jgi:phage virion morphogenesis protein
VSDLEPFEAYLSGLISNLEPTAQRTLARTIAQRLRESQSKRIGLQLNPDGSAYEPRKPQQRLRNKKGKLRRTMFAKLKQPKFLKARSTSTSAVVQFIGQVERIAQVHQQGLRDKVNKRRSNLEVKYPERRLLGISIADEEMLRDLVIEQLAR